MTLPIVLPHLALLFVYGLDILFCGAIAHFAAHCYRKSYKGLVIFGLAGMIDEMHKGWVLVACIGIAMMVVGLLLMTPMIACGFAGVYLMAPAVMQIILSRRERACKSKRP